MGDQAEWEWVLAGELGEFKGGSGFPTKYQGEGAGKYPFYKVSDMNSPGNEKFMNVANNYVSEEVRGSLGATAFPQHSIVFAKVGAAVFLERKRLLSRLSCIDNNMAAFIVDSTRLNSRFAHHALMNVRLGSLVAVGALPSLNGSQLRSIRLMLPRTRREQVQVANVLDEADALIDALERLIAKKRDVKRGLMQELLTGRTRLPGFTGGWEKSEIWSLATVIGGGTPPTRTPSYWGGGIPWFTPAEIDPAGSGLVSQSGRTITADGLANSSATLLPAGSVLVTSRASLGNCAVAEVPVSTNQGFTSMVPKDPRSTWFLYYWIQQNRFELESRAAGSTFLEISATKVATILLLIPDINEQQAIGAALKDADAEIEALERRLESARAVKVGMMQELLTGRTRLPVKEEA